MTECDNGNLPYTPGLRLAAMSHRQSLPEGCRGHGREKVASEILGISPAEYTDKADPWLLNPEGELLLGLKIEDQEGVANADVIASIPGIHLVTAVMGDMVMSLGYQIILPMTFLLDMINS